MRQTVRFQEILRRLAIIDEGFVDDQAGLGLSVTASRSLDPKTAALVQVGALMAIGSPGVCLKWSITRTLAAATFARRGQPGAARRHIRYGVIKLLLI
jgi:hypothetical protein